MENKDRPNKAKTSSQALIRRVLHGKAVPRIKVAVDAYNPASIETQVPIETYDYNKIREPLILRWSKQKEKSKSRC